jgi:hypothetical protein
MSMPPDAPPQPPAGTGPQAVARPQFSLRSWLLRHLRLLLAVLGGTMLSALIAIQSINTSSCSGSWPCDTLQSLARAKDAQAFEQAVQGVALPVKQSLVGRVAPAAASAAYAASGPSVPALVATSILPLRSMLLFDSLLLVPAYVGLLLLYLVLLQPLAYPPPARLPEEPPQVPLREWWLHAACLLAVAAGVFDIAENGMTVRAAEDALDHLLADPTVRDVQLATLLKWQLIGAATAVLGLLCWRLRNDARLGTRARWLQVAALCSVATAALLLVPYAWPEGLAAMPGGGLFGLALLLVGTVLWRAAPQLQASEQTSLVPEPIGRAA